VTDTWVLVVDDERPLREFVRRNLEVRGYKVETASNGLEALAKMESRAFDLVILDLMMPNMDGLEADPAHPPGIAGADRDPHGAG
jgi:two-component system response regulator MprA